MPNWKLSATTLFQFFFWIRMSDAKNMVLWCHLQNMYKYVLKCCSFWVYKRFFKHLGKLL
jgi:hypothetical protein